MRSSGLGWPEEPVTSSGRAGALVLDRPGEATGLPEATDRDDTARTGLGWPADPAAAGTSDPSAHRGPSPAAAPVAETGAAGEPQVRGEAAEASGATAMAEADAPALVDVSRETPVRTLEAPMNSVLPAALQEAARAAAAGAPPLAPGLSRELSPDVSRETDVTPGTPAETPANPLLLSGTATAKELAVTETVEPDDEPADVADDTPIARAAETALRVLAGRVGDPLPTPDETRILTVANQKGGVGKTTTTVNVAAALALQGLQVLVVDLDPQGNASTALGVEHHSEVPSIYDVLIEGRPLQEVVAPVEGIAGLWCAPATIDLAGAEIELVSLVARETRLQRALDAYQTWALEHRTSRLDYVLIDCPPSLGLLTVNALVAAPEVLIPIQCEYYALEGVGQLLRNIELVKAHLNPGLHVSTVLLTMYDARTRLAAQVADEVRTHFSATVLRTTIPRSVRISEAPSYGQTVMTYDPGSTGALSYLEAAREMALRANVRTGTEDPQ
jgi:chromosome partitioning protein